MSLFATLTNLGSAATVAESTSAGAWYEALFPVVHNEEEEQPEEEEQEEEDEEEEEEEEEPEDVYPEIYEGVYKNHDADRPACEKSAACESVRHHFEECQERVTEGKGFEGEDCVEEFPPGSLRSGVRGAVRVQCQNAYMHSKLFAQLV